MAVMFSVLSRGRQAFPLRNKYGLHSVMGAVHDHEQSARVKCRGNVPWRDRSLTPQFAMSVEALAHKGCRKEYPRRACTASNGSASDMGLCSTLLYELIIGQPSPQTVHIRCDKLERRLCISTPKSPWSPSSGYSGMGRTGIWPTAANRRRTTFRFPRPERRDTSRPTKAWGLRLHRDRSARTRRVSGPLYWWITDADPRRGSTNCRSREFRTHGAGAPTEPNWHFCRRGNAGTAEAGARGNRLAGAAANLHLHMGRGRSPCGSPLTNG